MSSIQPITCLADLMNIMPSVKKELGNSSLWWRGQEDASWELIPGIFRDDSKTTFENALITLFIQRAGSRYTPCPPKNDHASWLFLMQHHGLATRLLDWSESPLVALFFAVLNNNNKPGTLFVLNPYNLNDAHFKNRSIFQPDSSQISPFIESAFFKEKTNPDMPASASLIVNESSPRMLAQLTAMTIHSRKEPLSNASYLRHYEIPAEVKPALRDELWFLGIRQANLFPELSSLASELNELILAKA